MLSPKRVLKAEAYAAITWFCINYREILRVAYRMVPVKRTISKQLLRNRLQRFYCKKESRQHTLAPFVQACSLSKTDLSSSKLPKMASQRNKEIKIYATRRRRMEYSRTETYVLLEPGEEEKFVPEQELKAKLKSWLETWPGKALPPDLARFATIDEAVSFLIMSVFELEPDGDVGSIQWYEVRLE